MSDTMTKDESVEMQNLVNKIRERQEEMAKGTFTKSEFQAYEERVDKDLEKFDEKAEKIIADIKAKEEEEEKLKERIKHLETIIATGATNNNNSDPETLKRDAIEVTNAMLKSKGSWIKFSKDERNRQKIENVMSNTIKLSYVDGHEVKDMNFILKNYEQKADFDLLRSDIQELGGFLCPPEIASELDKNIIEKSPIRRFASVRNTGSKVLEIPIRVGIPVANRPGEARTTNRTVSNYVMQEWTPYRMDNIVPITREALLFENYNLVANLMQDNSEAFAVKEGQEFVSGSGVKEGLGFTVDPNVPEFETASNTLVFDDVIDVSGQLKQGYNAMYFFNRRTLTYLRKLKDQNDRYLWAGPFGDSAAGSPATINGLPYSAAFIDMDDYDVNDGYPILFADMRMFYMIVDRTDITVIRDEVTRKAEGIIEYMMIKYCFGKSRIVEAGVRLKKIA